MDFAQDCGCRGQKGIFFFTLRGRKQAFFHYGSSVLWKDLTALLALCHRLDEYAIKHISSPNELQSKHGKVGKSQCHWRREVEHGKIKQVVKMVKIIGSIP